MPAWLFVFGGMALLVVALLAVDWFTAGRAKRRFVRAKDQYSTDANVGYTIIEQHGRHIQQQNPFI